MLWTVLTYKGGIQHEYATEGWSHTIILFVWAFWMPLSFEDMGDIHWGTEFLSNQSSQKTMIKPAYEEISVLALLLSKQMSLKKNK